MSTWYDKYGADIKKQVLPQQVEDVLNQILNKGSSGSVLILNDVIADAMDSEKRFKYNTFKY